MLSLQIIKSMLSMAGINNLSVKFEPENKQIRTVFSYAGEHCEQIITFEQIEGIFTDGQQGPQQALQQGQVRKRVSQY